MNGMDRRPHTTHTQLSDHDSRSEALLDVCQIVLQGLCLELDEVALHISTELGRPSFVQVMVCVCELSKSKMDGWMDGFITVTTTHQESKVELFSVILVA